MIQWLLWSSVALTCRTYHTICNDYHRDIIVNGFENTIVNAYLFLLVCAVKLSINPTFYIDGNLILFGVANTLYPYWINKAKELNHKSLYTGIIMYSESGFLIVLSPIFLNCVNRTSFLLPIFCMMFGHTTMLFYDNQYSLIATDEESLQTELTEPLLRDQILDNLHIGFSTLSLGCIITKDIALGRIITTSANISDVLFFHQLFALLFSLFYKHYKNNDNIIIYNEPLGDLQKNVIATCILFNNGFVNFCYISSVYSSFIVAPNIGYSKLFINLYVPVLLCVKIHHGDRFCHAHYIGSYYCYILALTSIVYFGR
jgi:hypothetical protein